MLAGAMLAIAVTPSPAWADTASEAGLHFTLGSELYRQKRFEEALQHFIVSNRLVPNANVVFNIAQTYGLLRREIDAYNWYQNYLKFDSLDAAGRERGQRAADALGARVAVLDVVTTPPGAELFVDRLELGSVGEAPRRLAVAAGDHTVIARLAGHKEARVAATAAVGTVSPALLTLQPLVGTLVVESEPKGAAVRRAAGGERLGETPLMLTLPLGTVDLLIALEGYVEQARPAVIREDAETRVSVALQMAASKVSVLTVQGTPEGARVTVDGRDVGAVPLTVGGLSPGSRELTVDAPGHDGFKTKVLFEPGAATRVDVRLVSPADDRLRRLRWLGYGVGAAAFVAGAVTAVAALVGRGAYFSDPSAGRYAAVHAQNLAADVLMGSGAVLLIGTFLLDVIVFRPPRTEGAVNVVR